MPCCKIWQHPFRTWCRRLLRPLMMWSRLNSHKMGLKSLSLKPILLIIVTSFCHQSAIMQLSIHRTYNLTKSPSTNMPNTPSVPPTVDNIHPLSQKPSFAEMSFIRNRFDDDLERQFSRLSEESYQALLNCAWSGDTSEVERLANRMISLYSQQAERISRNAAPSTAAPPSQPETEESPTANGDRPDDTRTGASGTAHQQ